MNSLLYGKEKRAFRFLNALNDYRLSRLYKDPSETRRLKRLLDAANDPDFIRDRMVAVAEFCLKYGIHKQTVYAALKNRSPLAERIQKERRGGHWFLAMIATPEMFDAASESEVKL